jgi:hypothetical protein
MLAVYAVCALLAIPVGLAFIYRSLFLRSRRCLRCRSRNNLERVTRTSSERVIGRLVACRRYRCGQCGWIGLIREGVARLANESASPSSGEIRTFDS